MRWEFKEEKSFEERLKESEKILKKFTHRIPVKISKLLKNKIDLKNRK